MEEDESFTDIFEYHHHDADVSAPLQLDSQLKFDGPISPSNQLSEKMRRIGSKSKKIESWQDYELRLQLVETEMGSMALCRGRRGDDLHQAGAIYGILWALEEMYDKVPHPKISSIASIETENATKLAIACWGAARDLSCGSALTRDALRELKTKTGMCGLELMVLFLRRYHEIYWDDLDTLHLKLVTNVIGVMRNVTHSTTENCKELNDRCVTTMLIWRLKKGSKSEANLSLPSPSKRWREGAFRCCATLINMAEKSVECAKTCGMDFQLIPLLLESWGGLEKKMSVIHLGLVAVLQCAKDKLPNQKFDEVWDKILEREEARKLVARRREDHRKNFLTKRKEAASQ
mmetsp:Transcript_28016/g.41368  ORF Transcript_28016/g.41368 Transcript_28016/m.41368 type:complete len:347 (+) Transcript_28016:155-1195(+)|eukprot:CAMPEP_0194212888 /NCGR_PEP_ID=MMETSP0156-20130528/13041_1 /TAXON_ID=33649 /ORGANISM="Thalassionema nitzschioides, Strain L26-B" /LENGTH=346 /DNA_ID=CAMNT_0038940785 /DNA_START=122 /DNA_END=1162 /DNA_ORIENTATION=+